MISHLKYRVNAIRCYHPSITLSHDSYYMDHSLPTDHDAKVRLEITISSVLRTGGKDDQGSRKLFRYLPALCD